MVVTLKLYTFANSAALTNSCLTCSSLVTIAPPEHGTYVVQRNLKPATPDLYRVVFELDVNGQRVLEDLTKRFNRHAFVSDSQGGERETCRRLGQSEPVNFILSQINKANDPNYSEVENDA